MKRMLGFTTLSLAVAWSGVRAELLGMKQTIFGMD